MRAGYGISYDTWSVARDVSYVYPVRGTYTAPTTNSYSPAGTLATGIPAQTPPDLSAGSIPMPLNISTSTPANPYVRPYIQSFNFTLQKELKWGWVAQAGYVATRTIHNAGLADLNAGMILGAGTAGQPLFQKFGRTAAHASVLSLGKRPLRLFANLAGAPVCPRVFAEVRLHLVEDVGNVLRRSERWRTGDLCSPILQPQQGNSRNDLPHNFSATGIYQLPFGKGKHWLNRGGVAGALLSGWQLNGCVRCLLRQSIQRFGFGRFPEYARQHPARKPGNVERAVLRGVLVQGSRGLTRWPLLR